MIVPQQLTFWVLGEWTNEQHAGHLYKVNPYFIPPSLICDPNQSPVLLVVLPNPRAFLKLQQRLSHPRHLHFQSFILPCSSKTAAGAAANLHQSCPTLCDPIYSSPPGSPIPGILQARTLEWAAISSSNAWKWKVKSLSHVRLLATPWIIAYQAPPSMGFSRQEHWSGVPLPSPLVKLVLLKFDQSSPATSEFLWARCSSFFSQH